MSITSEITRIKNAKDRILNKIIELGIKIEDQLIDGCADGIESINNLGQLNMVIDNEQPYIYTIPAGYTTGGTIKIVNITHYYYKDLKLPKLPSSSISAYPYCWIRDNNQSGYYDLIMSTTSFYYDASNTRLKHRGSDTDLWYRLPKSTSSSATSWGSPQSHSYVGWTIGTDRQVFWSNHDVTQSESSSSIYFYGSNPVPDI